MMRVLVAAGLAVGIHGALFSIQAHWTPPALLIPQSRSVTISLVAAPPASSRKTVPPPVVKPPPKPKPVKAPALVTEAVPDPEHAPMPEIQAAEPEQQLPQEESIPAEAPTTQSRDNQEGAVIKSSAPRYDINPVPIYPRVAKRRGYEGTVLLAVWVTREGRAGRVKVVRSSGHAILDRRALSTVQEWLFTPAMRGTEPVEMRVEVPIVFKFDQ